MLLNWLYQQEPFEKVIISSLLLSLSLSSSLSLLLLFWVSNFRWSVSLYFSSMPRISVDNPNPIPSNQGTSQVGGGMKRIVTDARNSYFSNDTYVFIFCFSASSTLVLKIIGAVLGGLSGVCMFIGFCCWYRGNACCRR